MSSFWLSGALLMLLWAIANSHVMWTCPTPRVANSALKLGPCGGPGQGLITDAPQIVVQPGPFSMIFQETVFHVGAPFRIALSMPKDDDYEECVLLNHIPHNDNGEAGWSYAITVQIPDFNCSFCSLQIIQVMTDKIPAFLGSGHSTCTYNPNETLSWAGDQCGGNYHSCTNVIINGTKSFNSSECTQPSGWNMTRGQYDYVYGSESGTWTNGFLTDSRAPNSVRTVAEGTYCAATIATTQFTPTTVDSGILAAIIIIVVAVCGFMLVMYFRSKNKAQQGGKEYVPMKESGVTS